MYLHANNSLECHEPRKSVDSIKPWGKDQKNLQNKHSAIKHRQADQIPRNSTPALVDPQGFKLGGPSQKIYDGNEVKSHHNDADYYGVREMERGVDV